MQDIVVIQNLQKKGFDFSSVDALMYEAIERKPRILDRPPKRLTIAKAKETPTFGCKSEFIMAYEELDSNTTGELFTLDLAKVTRYCDREVFVVLQTLIRQGMTNIEEIANACYDLFRVISTVDFDTITKERVYQVLQPIKCTNYYSSQLLEAVNLCLFGENPIVLYWKDQIAYNGLYKAAIEKGCELLPTICSTEKEVDKFIRDNVRLAKADKDFIKSTYTDGVSKALLAFLYYIRKDNPELLDPDCATTSWT